MRIVVTGVGALSAIGGDAESFWQGLLEGRRGIEPLTRFDTARYPAHLGAQLPGGLLEGFVGSKGLAKYDRIQLATLGAARMAWQSAALAQAGYEKEELGVVLGSTYGYVDSVSTFYSQALIEGPIYVSPLMFANTVMNAPAGKIAIDLGITGLCSTLATGETAGLDALAYAWDFVRNGQCGAVLVGAGSVLCDAVFAGFCETGKLSGCRPGTAEACLPFDTRANGIVLGEGAGMLVVEAYERVRQGNRRILAEIRGYASGFALDRDNREDFMAVLAGTMEQALAEAGIAPAELSMISASAGSDPYLDSIEAAAIAKVFGGRRSPPVTAIKALTGECLDASSLLQAVAAVYSIQERRVPAIPRLDLAHVHAELNYATRALEQPVQHVLINSVSCSGKVASAIISRCGDGRE